MVAADSSGHQYSGTVNGSGSGVTRGTPGLLFDDGERSTTFAGATDGISVPRNGMFESATTLSAEAWVRFASNATSNAAGRLQTIVGYGKVGYAIQYDSVRNAFVFRLHLASGPVAVEPAVPSSAHGPAVYHVIGTYDGSVATVYVNGQIVATQHAAGSVLYDAASYGTGVTIGNDVGGSTPLFAAVQDVALYHTMLTAADVRHHYELGTGRVSAPLPALSPSPAPLPTVTTGAALAPQPTATPRVAVTPLPAMSPRASPTPLLTVIPLPSPTSLAPLLLPPAGSIYLGARVHPRDGSTTADLETAMHRKLALDDHYASWNSVFPGSEEFDDLANGRHPVVAWNCGYSNASVAAGQHDADIIAVAKNIKAYGQPIFLRWFWEFNLSDASNGGRSACYDPLTDDPGGYFNATNFIAAWRHLHDVFVAQNVTNVIWLWCASSGGSAHAPATAYYPGDAYVDWTGFDGYALSANESLTQTFGSMYTTVTAMSNKPVMVAETAAIGSDQVGWLTGADVTLATTFPRILGFMYFDVYKPTDRADWSLTTSGNPSGLQQFTLFANSPYLGAH